MQTILLISPYWKEQHRWMVSSVKLAELWQRRGYRVVVACMGAESGTEQVSDTIVVHRRKDLFIPDPWNTGICIGFSGFVRRLVAQEKPDLIVVNKMLFWTSLSIFPLRVLGHRPILITDALVGMTWWPRSVIPRIVAFAAAWTVGWGMLLAAKKIVFFHPQPESLLRSLGVLQKSTVIPTGIDAGMWHIEKRRDDRSFTITYTGRLESVKGVDDFVAAAIKVKQQYPDIRIRVIGWYKKGHPLVQEYRDQVEFMGPSEDVMSELAKTDLFVLPSYSEGLSNSLMEAMSTGCVCIASDVGGNRFLIQNGVSGFLYPPGDREALAAHIRRLIEDPAKRMSLAAAARQRIEDVFDWGVVGMNYQKLFKNFLQNQS